MAFLIGLFILVLRGFSKTRRPKRPADDADVVCCFEDDDAQEIARLMDENQIYRLVVLNRDKRAAGSVSLGDLGLKTSDEQLAGKTSGTVSDLF